MHNGHEVGQHHAMLNRLHTILLLGFIAGFLALLGWLLWGQAGIWILWGLAFTLVSANITQPPALVMRWHGARALSPEQAPWLYRALNELSNRAQLSSTPTLYYVPSRIINAFTVGSREDAAIAVTYGLIRSLTPREQASVLAHEISHIRSNDTRVLALANLCGRLTTWLALVGQLLLLVNLPLMLAGVMTINWFAIAILIFGPNVSVLAQMGLSRVREYEADRNAARLTGDPEAQANALIKIERLQGGWLERLMLSRHAAPETTLFRTHPPTQARVQRLMELSDRDTVG